MPNVLASDLLWFLLPVAAAAGWFAAQRSNNERGRGFWNYSQRFHEEINQLLSDKDSLKGGDSQLFDTFTQGAKDAAETHIALGNLYRRRGEFDRAIRLHENISGRQELSKDLQVSAHFELARDYEAAGLMDRSALELRALIQGGQRLDEAFDALLQLHEAEQDWSQAVNIALEYEAACHKSLGHKIAHYYCELAELGTGTGDTGETTRLLKLALEQSPSSARVHILLANLALSEARFEKAITHFNHVETIDSALMPVIIEKRFAAFRGVGDKQALKAFVLRIQQQKNAYSVIRTTRQVIAEESDERTADRFFKDQILKRPSLKGLRDWAHDQLALSKPDEKAKVQVICNLLDQVMEDKPAYRCRSCGFQGNVMHWRCPSCGSWDSVSTIIGVEGE